MTETVFPLPLADLLVPAAEMIDGQALIAAISAEIGAKPEARATRAIAVRHMAEAKARGNARLQQAFADHPLAARALVTAQSHLTLSLIHI